MYLIECVGGSIYTGISTDVAARYRAHAGGRGARYTRAFPPVRLLGSFAYPDRSSASRAEYRIRTLPPAAKRALCSGVRQPPVVPPAPAHCVQRRGSRGD